MADQNGLGAGQQVPKKIIERSFVWFILGVIVAAVVGTISVLTWLEEFVDSRVAAAGGNGQASAALPNGLVIASLDECSALTPGKWGTFRQAAGRVIVGVGAGSDDEGNGKDFEQPGDTGGVYSVRLQEHEIPPHVHATPLLSVNNQAQMPLGVDKRVTNGIAGSSYGPVPNTFGALTTSAGGEGNRAAAHNNMPPYIALYFCKKEG